MMTTSQAFQELVISNSNEGLSPLKGDRPLLRVDGRQLPDDASHYDVS